MTAGLIKRSVCVYGQRYAAFFNGGNQMVAAERETHSGPAALVPEHSHLWRRINAAARPFLPPLVQT